VSEGAAREDHERPYPGLFLAFEGVEGSGKSTQAALLAEELRSDGANVTLAREPGTTPLGERVRALVLEGADLDIPGRSELFLMLAARAAFVDQVVRPALQAGHVVVSDRFELSTLAYQGAGRGVPVEEIRRSNALATGGLSPDATILLTLPPEEGARRQEVAAKRRDRLEREGLEFHRRVARGYEELADRVPGIVRVDASGTIEEVRRGVRAALGARFPETFAG
jgi:dTMP kinase